MQAARQGNTLKGKQPSQVLSVLQWSRTNLFLEGVNLDRFREGDMKYVDELVDAALKKKKKLPRQYRRTSNGKYNFKAKVRETVQHLFKTPADLPYEIDHWKIGDKWMGLGLFTTRRIHTKTLGQLLAKAEPNNCELMWADACYEGYDSLYTCNWQETVESAQVRWGMKQHLVSNANKVKRNHIGFRAIFAVYGRLMFANHHNDADFFFEGFAPMTPEGKNERIQGKLTIRPHNKEHWRYLEAKEQILIFYDFNMTFGNEPAESEGLVETGGDIIVALSMMDVDGGAEEEGIMDIEAGKGADGTVVESCSLVVVP
jgi:hypothetical protein